MALSVISQAGIPQSVLPEAIRLAKLNPRYVAHLAVDESDTTSLLVTVMREAAPADAATTRSRSGSRAADPKPAPTRKTSASRRSR